MKIDKKLNLVIPAEVEGGIAYFHSTPVSREVFEQYYLIIGKVFAALYSEGLQIVAGPQLAFLMLRDIAEKMDRWEDVQKGFLSEIRRLTNVVMLGDQWGSVPLQDVIDRKMIDAEVLREVESAIVFFTVSSAMHKRGMLSAMMEVANGLYGWQTTSLNSTAFTDSLRTSTETDNSGGTPSTSSAIY